MKNFLILLVLTVSTYAQAFTTDPEMEIQSHGFEHLEYVSAFEHELFETSHEKGFPDKRVRAYDPINKQYYHKGDI
jgi:hypothetical protein